MNDPPQRNERADWDAHRAEQRAAFAAATPEQRLAWLEQAIALAHASGALPRREQPDSGQRPE